MEPMIADPWSLIEEHVPAMLDAETHPHRALEIGDEVFIQVKSCLAVDNGFSFEVSRAVAEVVVVAAQMIAAERLSAEQACLSALPKEEK